MRVLLSVICLFLVCSCTSNKLDSYDGFISKGQYVKAKDFALKTDKDLLWTLQAASAARAAGDYQESNKLFDKAEFLYKQTHGTHDAEDVARGAGQVLFSDAALPYKGEVHDGIMINVYKALNFMSLNKWSLARIELNRAYDRQRRAADFYAKEIAEQQDKLGEKAELLDIDKMVEDPKVNRRQNVKAYADYVNPIVNLLELSFLVHKGVSSDKERIRQTRDRLMSMTQSSQVGKDYSKLNKKAWVIIENGESPRKLEYRVDIPLEHFTGIEEIKYTGIALPYLKNKKAKVSSFSVNNESAELVCDMDRVITAEFDRAFKGILLRAVSSLVLKSAAQFAAQRKGGDSSAWMVAAFQAFTTHADIRVWSGLPKSYYFALVPCGEINLKSQGLNIASVKTETDSLVFFKVTSTGSVTKQVIELN